MKLVDEGPVQNAFTELVRRHEYELEPGFSHEIGARLGCIDDEYVDAVLQTPCIRKVLSQRVHGLARKAGLLGKLATTTGFRCFSRFEQATRKLPSLAADRGAKLTDDRYSPTWRAGDGDDVVRLSQAMIEFGRRSDCELNRFFDQANPR